VRVCACVRVHVCVCVCAFIKTHICVLVFVHACVFHMVYKMYYERFFSFLVCINTALCCTDNDYDTVTDSCYLCRQLAVCACASLFRRAHSLRITEAIKKITNTMQHM
jgi:hypothetical protein